MAENIYELIQQNISFEVYGDQILGHGFSNVKLLGIMDADSVRMVGNIDPQSLHQAIFRFLPEGSTPDNYQQYSYARVQFANGSISAVGIPWIKSATITKLETANYQYTLVDVKPGDVERYAEILRSYGANVLPPTRV